MCRTTVAKAVSFAKRSLVSDTSKAYVSKVMQAALVKDAVECVRADQKEFAAFVGLTADDLGVLLRYQESLIFNCAKWKP
jgi:hypothetical protein